MSGCSSKVGEDSRVYLLYVPVIFLLFMERIVREAIGATVQTPEKSEILADYDGDLVCGGFADSFAGSAVSGPRSKRH